MRLPWFIVLCSASLLALCGSVQAAQAGGPPGLSFHGVPNINGVVPPPFAPTPVPATLPSAPRATSPTTNPIGVTINPVGLQSSAAAAPGSSPAPLPGAIPGLPPTSAPATSDMTPRLPEPRNIPTQARNSFSDTDSTGSSAGAPSYLLPVQSPAVYPPDTGWPQEQINLTDLRYLPICE